MRLEERKRGMSKPQLCLALSVGITLTQANLLPALADPEAGAIWQKLSGTSAKKTSASTPAKAKAVKPSAGHVASRQSASAVVPDGHAMLFLTGKGKQSALPGAIAPAAALTI